MKKVLVIDGQGGGLGKQIVKALKDKIPNLLITAIGINSIATSQMHKSGADIIATGENAIIVNSKKADIIVGPIGIIITDALCGEVTQKISNAISQSSAMKVLIPFNNCNTLICGVTTSSINALIDDSVSKINELLK